MLGEPLGERKAMNDLGREVVEIEHGAFL